MRIATPPQAVLRALCFGAFIAVLAQLFILDEPRFVLKLVYLTWDKFCHATAFGLFALLLWVAIGFRWSLGNWLAIVAVGALDEFHQLFVPGRTADVLDLLSDAIGAAVVTYALHRLSLTSSRKPPLAHLAPQPGD